MPSTVTYHATSALLEDGFCDSPPPSLRRVPLPGSVLWRSFTFCPHTAALAPVSPFAKAHSLPHLSLPLAGSYANGPAPSRFDMYPESVAYPREMDGSFRRDSVHSPYLLNGRTGFEIVREAEETAFVDALSSQPTSPFHAQALEFPRAVESGVSPHTPRGIEAPESGTTRRFVVPLPRSAATTTEGDISVGGRTEAHHPPTPNRDFGTIDKCGGKSPAEPSPRLKQLFRHIQDHPLVHQHHEYCCGQPTYAVDAHTSHAKLNYVATVHYRGREGVVASAHLYNPGSMVVVDGDEGIHCGEVAECAVPDKRTQDMLSKASTPGCFRGRNQGASLSPDKESASVPHSSKSRSAPVGTLPCWGFIHRMCTEEEVDFMFTTLRECEQAILDFVRGLVPSQFHDCRVDLMSFMECEVQADCRKIYLYYTRKTMDIVRHRELSHMLHRHFRCRIWLHEVNRGSHNSSLHDHSDDAVS